MIRVFLLVLGAVCLPSLLYVSISSAAMWWHSWRATNTQRNTALHNSLRVTNGQKVYFQEAY